MFSTGQWIFVIFFVIAFIILMLLAYRKDARLHKKQYKGSKWVLVGFLAFIGLLFVIKIVLKR
jgi:hypothetical protein